MSRTIVRRRHATLCRAPRTRGSRSPPSRRRTREKASGIPAESASMALAPAQSQFLLARLGAIRGHATLLPRHRLCGPAQACPLSFGLRMFFGRWLRIAASSTSTTCAITKAPISSKTLAVPLTTRPLARLSGIPTAAATPSGAARGLAERRRMTRNSSTPSIGVCLCGRSPQTMTSTSRSDQSHCQWARPV